MKEKNTRRYKKTPKPKKQQSLQKKLEKKKNKSCFSLIFQLF